MSQLIALLLNLKIRLDLKCFLNIVSGSMDVQTPPQLGIPVEGDGGFDGDASYQLMEEITTEESRIFYSK